ncbi:unnamed protein product [Closterium sp. NIES-64]|nr:unnamed protein product [Closterium sp. NIES-64]
MPRLLASPHLAASHAASPRFPPSRVFQSRASNASGGCLGGKWAETLTLRRDISSGGDWGNRGRQGSAESYAGRSWGEGRSRRRGVCCSTGTGGKGFGGGQGTGESAGGAKGSSAAKKDEKKQESGAFGGLDWREVARPAPPMLDLSKPRGQGRVARGGASRWHQEKPKATIGKFYAPTPQLPDPLKSKLTPGDVALGGGGSSTYALKPSIPPSSLRTAAGIHAFRSCLIPWCSAATLILLRLTNSFSSPCQFYWRLALDNVVKTRDLARRLGLDNVVKLREEDQASMWSNRKIRHIRSHMEGEC